MPAVHAYVVAGAVAVVVEGFDRACVLERRIGLQVKVAVSFIDEFERGVAYGRRGNPGESAEFTPCFVAP